jgi:FkbM family methyltransferase
LSLVAVSYEKDRAAARVEPRRARKIWGHPIKRTLNPLLRSYCRYAPWNFGKNFLWHHVIEPFFAWTSQPFVARTVFGAPIEGNTRDLIQKYIYYFGAWEPNLTQWVQGRLKPGDTFIDVGANIGYFTLLASKFVGPSGRVVSIEASPTIFERLERNVARAGARNVRAINRAVFDKRGTVDIYQASDDNIGRTTILATPEYEVECQVEAEPLCELLRAEEAQNARIVKIDIEGATWFAIADLQKLLPSMRPDLEIVAEIDPEPLARFGKQPEDILRMFESAGFHAYRLENITMPYGYLPGYTLKRPLRNHEPIETCTDFVFSRQDAESL